MNLQNLYDELIEVLAENSAEAPQYWSVTELKRYLNRGNTELVKQGGFNKFLLPLLPAELGAFYPPADILKLKTIYYNGKALDQKSTEFLDAHYGGTAHQQIKSGDGLAASCNWRNEIGVPIHWYFENNKIKLYPAPETAAPALAMIRGKLTGTIAAGDTGITLSGSIPLDQNRVDFFYNGSYQNKDQWSIASNNRINFTGWSANGSKDYEVVYIPDSISLSIIQKSEKYLIYVAAGQTTVNVPGGYTQGIGALAVRKNGATQAPGAFTETSISFITIPVAVADCTYEITVTRADPTQTMAALYIQAPPTLINNSDRPQIDNEDWQRGIVHYAAHLALSKEGKMSQDIEKAAIHLNRFNEVIDSCSTMTKPPVSISPFVAMPF